MIPDSHIKAKFRIGDEDVTFEIVVSGLLLDPEINLGRDRTHLLPAMIDGMARQVVEGCYKKGVDPRTITPLNRNALDIEAAVRKIDAETSHRTQDVVKTIASQSHVSVKDSLFGLENVGFYLHGIQYNTERNRKQKAELVSKETVEFIDLVVNAIYSRAWFNSYYNTYYLRQRFYAEFIHLVAPPPLVEYGETP